MNKSFTRRPLALFASVALMAIAAVSSVPAQTAVADEVSTVSTPSVAPSAASASSSPSAASVSPSANASTAETTEEASTEPTQTAQVQMQARAAAVSDPNMFGGYAVTNGFKTYYLANGGPSGFLGLPLEAEHAGAKGGSVQNFQGGTLFYSAATGVKVTTAGFRDQHRGLGAEGGKLGYPVTNETRTKDGGTYQVFQGGTAYWSPRTNVSYVSDGFFSQFSGLGFEWGKLGYPMTNETRTKDGGTYQVFQGGTAYWSADSGVTYVSDGFFSLFGARGFEWSDLGFPRGNETRTKDGGTYQNFQGGVMYWSPSTGVQAVEDGFLSNFAGKGYEWSWLGFPTSGEYQSGAGTVQQFQGGTMYYDRLGVTASAGERALQWGTTQIGKPYGWGATGPDAYDCSGFTQAAFRSQGVSIPRTSNSQPAAGIPVSYDQLQPGDLVFSYGYGHVAIYAGNGKVLNALNYGTPLGYTELRYIGFDGAVRVAR